MTKTLWLIYGASGYSGALIAAEAVRRGQRPILAGRTAAKLAPLAQRLGLEARVADLADAAALARMLKDVGLVIHAAGPFIHTSAPLVAACLRQGAHYLDITGEVPVFEQTLALDAEARAAGLCVLSGAGFDVVPSDCLARYLAEQLPSATQLEIAVAARGGLSPGTAKSALEHMAPGALVRRAGQLRAQPLGTGARRVRFTDGAAVYHWSALPSTWGDLSTAYRSTRIPDITTYLSFPARLVNTLRWAGPAMQVALGVGAVRGLAQAWIGRAVHGPDEPARAAGHGYVWARVADAHGAERQAWLVTPEPYHFTALSAVACAERVQAQALTGALTPALAGGADFVLSFPGVRRFDTLP